VTFAKNGPKMVPYSVHHNDCTDIR
jgi:hypothetical protein